MFRFSGVFLVCLLWPALATAELSETVDYNYYEVSAEVGATGLMEHLNSASPVRRGDKVFHAHTDWDIDWQFDWQSENEQCRIVDVTVSLDAIILLPAMSSADADLQQQFNTYVAELQRHETGHYTIAVQAANAIVLQLERLAAESCSVIEEQANQLALAIIDAHVLKEKEYDRVTRHGADQDAWEMF
ncbi:MAG TPA: DUF922 domain-containing protein [Cellvibrionaceae bacterium]